MQGVAAAERIAPLLAQPLPLGYEGREPVPSAPLGISFHQVGFRYGGERGGVTGIDLELPAGSCTALAGESGSGKSTLVRLLVGLARPETGKIRINGLDLGEIEPVAWRQQLALVPQRPFFFTGTIGENLLLGCPEATESAILEALAEAGALDFVQRLPDGLASRLGDRGAGLSGGELRRLALARVFLRNPSVVILDEPTAGLDPASERQVLQALRRLAAGRTLLIISHREETLALAERVVVLAAGKVLPRALPAELSGPEARA
jgi:ATP-binding cassette subfamily C protein CydD